MFWSAARKVPRPLALLLAVATIEVVAWTAFTTPFQGADEQAHFGYVQHIAETGHPPVRGFTSNGIGPYSTEQTSGMNWFNLIALVGVADARPVWNAADLRYWRNLEGTYGKSWSRKDGGDRNSIAQNPPLYYLYEAVPYRVASSARFFNRVFLMRLASGALFVATVLFVWLLAGEVFDRRRWLQTLAAAAVALLPQLAYMSTVINPDTLVTTLWAAFMWLAVRLTRGRGGTGTFAAMVLVVAASALTHGRGLALLVPAAGAIALTLRRWRPPLVKTLALLAGTAVVVGAAIAAGFAITHGSTGGSYGGEATVAAHGFTLRGFASYVWQFYLPKLPGMNAPPVPGYGFDDVYVRTFFGTFGSLEVQFPGWVYTVLHIASVAGIAALIGAFVAHRGELRRNWPSLAVLALALLALVGILHYVAFRDLLHSPGDPVIVGRYILPLVPLFAIAIAFVARALPRRAGFALAAAVVVAGCLLQLAGIGITAARFYA